MSDGDLEPNMAPETVDVDEHRSAVLAQTQVREIFQALIKHGRTSRLYGVAHQHTVGFLQSFVDGLESFLKHEDMLFVEIEPDQIIFQGKQVLAASSHGELLIYGLYSEGARAIGVDREAPRAELEGLAHLLSQDWSQRSDLEDDLVAATWRREFEHVHIDVADRFSEEDEFGDAVIREDVMLGQGPGGRDSRHARGDSVLIPEIQGILAELESNASQQEGTQSVVRLKQDEAQLYLSLQDDLKNTMGMASHHSEEEAELLVVEPSAQAELTRELKALQEGRDLSTDKVGLLFFEVIRQEPREGQVVFLTRHIARHCSSMCASQNVELAANLVRRFLLLCDSNVFPDFPFPGSIRRGFASFIQGSNRTRLLESLPNCCVSQEHRAALFTLLSLLSREQLPELVRFGADLRQTEIRQVIADVVIEMVERDEEALLTLLVTGHEEEAIIPLMALGRLESPAVIEESLRRMGSPSADLREACMRAFRGQNLPRIRQEVLRCLKDDESSIRIEALRYLAVYRQRMDLPLLESTLRSPGFAAYSEEEIKAWVMCYGLVGRNDAIKLLRMILEDKEKLAASADVLKPLCIQALVTLDTPESQGALELLGRKDEAMKGQIKRFQSGRRGRR